MHSPPWTAPLRVSNRSLTEIRDAAGDIVLNLFTVGDRETLPAIVKICNCHDALVAALKEIDRWSLVIASAMRHDAPSDLDAVASALTKIRAALALAGGEG